MFYIYIYIQYLIQINPFFKKNVLVHNVDFHAKE
jgi:hypothetical protein